MRSCTQCQSPKASVVLQNGMAKVLTNYFIPAWFFLNTVFETLYHCIYGQIIHAYALYVNRVDVIFLNQSRRISPYKVHIVWLYADYLWWCLTGNKGVLYKPIQAIELEARALRCISVHNASCPAAVIIKTRWNGKRCATVYHSKKTESGEHLELNRVSCLWEHGHVLDARIVAGTTTCTSIDVTADVQALLPGAAALTPRELVVLLTCIGRLQPDKTISLLASNVVSTSLVLDNSLQELVADDGSQLHAAKCIKGGQVY